MSDLCNEIEKFGKGIGNTSRYRIVEALFKGSKTVGQLVETVELSQPLVSQHLKILKESNVVTDERQGQEVLYTLNTQYITTLLTSLVKKMDKDKKLQ
ncbi:MAG: hypothetical protein RJA61_431 [Candidatus Parcubacteria bacterium]|jgi:DNA-binding transcriptional ArsR family regulator